MMSHPVARTEYMVLHLYTNHECQRTRVNVGVVNTAVVHVCIFPAGRALLLLTEFLRSSSIASQAAERENTFIFIPCSPKLQQTHERLFFILNRQVNNKNICSEINTATPFLSLLFSFWLKCPWSNEGCCQPDCCLLLCGRDFWQMLCCKQGTSLPRLNSWPDGVTWHCCIWHRRRYHYSTSTLRNMCPWLLSFSVFLIIYYHLCMWLIHIIQLQSLLHNPNSTFKTEDLMIKNKDRHRGSGWQRFYSQPDLQRHRHTGNLR